MVALPQFWHNLTTLKKFIIISHHLCSFFWFLGALIQDQVALLCSNPFDDWIPTGPLASSHWIKEHGRCRNSRESLGVISLIRILTLVSTFSPSESEDDGLIFRSITNNFQNSSIWKIKKTKIINILN